MNYKKNVFRKTSLDRVSSPEQLNDYIKVSYPGTWFILITVAVMLIGVLVWSALGTLTTSRDAVAVAANGKAVCYLHPEETSGLAAGIPVEIANGTGTVIDIAAAPIEITPEFDAYALYLGGFQTGDFVLPVTVDIAVPDGVYPAKVIVESISPISFLLN